MRRRTSTQHAQSPFRSLSGPLRKVLGRTSMRRGRSGSGIGGFASRARSSAGVKTRIGEPTKSLALRVTIASSSASTAQAIWRLSSKSEPGNVVAISRDVRSTIRIGKGVETLIASPSDVRRSSGGQSHHRVAGSHQLPARSTPVPSVR